jgi:hypothetical protein
MPLLFPSNTDLGDGNIDQDTDAMANYEYIAFEFEGPDENGVYKIPAQVLQSLVKELNHTREILAYLQSSGVSTPMRLFTMPSIN